MGKLIVDSVSMMGFRSWASGLFEFQPGVTLVVGGNGSGKSTIGMAVQYAINGKLSKLNKDDLKQRGATAPMKVKVSCTRDGDKLSVERGQKLFVRQNNEAVSVRESSFMAELQRSIDYSFLSQNMASFVDMPEYKRRELLDSLIPEVTLTRSIAAPYLKNISKKYYERRYNFENNIQYAQNAITDMDNSIRSAEVAYAKTHQRQQEILALQQQELPFTEEEYQDKLAKLKELQKQLNEFRLYQRNLSQWITNTYNTNKDIDRHSELLQFYHTEQQKLELREASLQERKKQKPEISCPSCKAGLVCANCGNKIIDLEASGAIDEMIAENQKSLEKIKAEYQKILAVALPEKVSVEQLQQEEANMNKAANDMVALEATIAKLTLETDGYAVKAKNIEVARQIVLDENALASLQTHISELQERKKLLQEQLNRKEQTFQVMLKTEENLNKSVDILYSVLPIMYFDQFLRRLTYACNYLLESVLNMKIEMSASADGISIFVGKNKLSQLSSGELQRVRVAVTLAFSLLAVRTDTLFLDELFDTALDTNGMEALAALLRGPIMKFYDKIVVITHNTELMAALNPDRTIRIFKDKNGVSAMENM